MEPSNYKCGDVVWVMAGKRLGWWAGRVENVEKLRQDLVGDVTDKTIAVVKYLNEDNYQFVEDEAIICAYDSDRKEEYISIGMSEFWCWASNNYRFFVFFLYRESDQNLDVLRTFSFQV